MEHALRKPPALRPGDTVGIAAPAGPPPDPAVIERGMAWLEGQGLGVRLGPHARRRHGYLAGSDAERLAGLHELFGDPAVRAVICLRGGYGALRLLDRLDYGLIRAYPKIFLGYSDITALHLALHRHAGLVTFHGPMLAGDFGAAPSPYTVASWRRALFSTAPSGEVCRPLGVPPPVTITGGTVCGPLIGGNLSLICATLGTPCEIETAGRILFLEEVGEAPYRIDRMLTQLRLAGKLDRVAGVVVGECAGCQTPAGRTLPGRPPPGRISPGQTLEWVLRDRLGDLGAPVLYGLAIGHGFHRATLPLGVMATLDASRGWLRVDESGCVE